MWREMAGPALLEWVLEAPEAVTVFFYTPTCGNCKMARRVLDEALRQAEQTTVIACNINLLPQAAEKWQVERIPALLRLQQGTVARRRYDFPSSSELATWLR